MARLALHIALLMLFAFSFTKQQDLLQIPPTTQTTCSSDRRPTKITTNCCSAVSGARIEFEVYDYYHQNALSPCVEAIVFNTEKGKVCSNPKARWVQKKIKELPKTN